MLTLAPGDVLRVADSFFDESARTGEVRAVLVHSLPIVHEHMFAGDTDAYGYYGSGRTAKVKTGQPVLLLLCSHGHGAYPLILDNIVRRAIETGVIVDRDYTTAQLFGGYIMGHSEEERSDWWHGKTAACYQFVDLSGDVFFVGMHPKFLLDGSGASRLRKMVTRKQLIHGL